MKKKGLLLCCADASPREDGLNLQRKDGFRAARIASPREKRILLVDEEFFFPFVAASSTIFVSLDDSLSPQVQLVAPIVGFEMTFRKPF